MLKKLFTSALAAVLITGTAGHATTIKEDFSSAADSLTVLLGQRTGVISTVRTDKILKRGNRLDFYFTRDLGDYPWRDSDIPWFRGMLEKLSPEKYAKYSIGSIYIAGQQLNSLITPMLNDNGLPSEYVHRHPAPTDGRLVTEIGARDWKLGMSGRHIALWQSHGRYYEESKDRWQWQRAPVHRTVEDLYTQSYVLPFLIPMLENAGAYILTPRERDTQPMEIICDNDRSFPGERTGLLRRKGGYRETGNWKDAGTGFADTRKSYFMEDNPFVMGSARYTECTSGKKSRTAEARWTPTFEERGEYAVYVSYKTFQNSSRYARYTVHHINGETSFLVNQTMGGGTWIYLGTFEFDKGDSGYVTLDNGTSEGRNTKGKVVCADAVKFGGGMGKIARGPAGADRDSFTTSGLPSYTEGALYWMKWAGAPADLFEKWEDDYTKDFAGRGKWVSRLSGGSSVNPKEEGLGIPIDVSLAFHTDAGITPNDSIVGTLAIYTLKQDGKRTLPSGYDRISARSLADLIQTQICEDIREDFEPEWSRRMLWDRSYSECRTTSVPGVLLELLSHQNFADMKYGLDPTFRFTVSRAVYKGMLKFLSNLYNVPYAVQPLPINSFAAILSSPGKVRLSWKETADKKEPTAKAKGFIVYTRVDDGPFDGGHIVKSPELQEGVYSTEETISAGHIYSFRVVAFNDGGRSFPSETLAVGEPSSNSRGKVLVVNNFDRISAPSWFDSDTYAGFDSETDFGMGYIKDISYIGENYNLQRNKKWINDDNPGFGATMAEHEGETVPGNTFDFVSVHGAALLSSGYSFSSSSRDAWNRDFFLSDGTVAVDILCGKQVTSAVGRRAVSDRFSVFPTELQESLCLYAKNGGGIIISGSDIATDVWDNVFPVEVDSTYRENTKRFVERVLGYKWYTNFGTNTGKSVPKSNRLLTFSSPASFRHTYNNQCYWVNRPDGIEPSSSLGQTVMEYTGTRNPAAVAYKAEDGHKCVSFGFPLETVCDPAELSALIGDSLEFILSKR